MQANTIQPKVIDVVVLSGNHTFTVSDGAMTGQEGQEIVQNQVHTNISYSLFLTGGSFAIFLPTKKLPILVNCLSILIKMYMNNDYAKW